MDCAERAAQRAVLLLEAIHGAIEADAKVAEAVQKQYQAAASGTKE